MQKSFFASLVVGLSLSAGALLFSVSGVEAADTCKDKATASHPMLEYVSAYCLSAAQGACPTGIDAKSGLETFEYLDTSSCSGPGQRCCAEMKPKKGSDKMSATSTKATGGSSIKLKDPLGGVGLYGLVRRLISGVLGLVGAVALLVFFVSGIMYMVGGEENVKKARDAMANAAIGLAIIFFAYTITSFFFSAFTTVTAAP